MSTISFLHAITRHQAVTAPIVTQATVTVLLLAGHPILAAVAACIGIAGLAALLATADDRANRLHADRDTARITGLNAELAEANTDPVTGLPVRRLAERHITGAVGVELTVAVIDVDDMHGINNSRGRQFGDAYLAGIAQRLQQAAVDGDLIARLGGDEFAHITTRSPLVLAQALTAAIREPLSVNGTAVPVQLSIGICLLPGGDAHDGLGRADLAMYTAKRRGSGIAHYDPVRDGIQPPPGVRPAVRLRDRRAANGPSGGTPDGPSTPTGTAHPTGRPPPPALTNSHLLHRRSSPWALT